MLIVDAHRESRFMKKMMRRATALAAAGAMAIATAAVTTGAAQASGTVLTVDNAIDGRYIVVLNDDAYAAASDLVADYDGKVLDTFSSINGFSAELSASDAAKLAADPAVDYVQQDGIVSLADDQTNPPSWGLDRIDQRKLPLDDVHGFPGSAGVGVHAYVIDTGVDLDHPEFVGRISSGVDTVDGDAIAEDCNGHGTHVAGTIAGTEYGVAKKANVVAVRVLDCFGSGSFAGVIKGVEWVTLHAKKPAVANMSLGGGFNQAVNDAVEASVASGVTYAVAAGNDYGYDACNVSPASAPSAITVGATDINDNRAGFSNIGPCVDIFAPGVNIASAWLNGGTNTISGTSMASPHVAGAAALQLGENPGATPAQVAAALGSNATPGIVGNPGTGSPNLLLYTGYLNGYASDAGNFSLSVLPGVGTMRQGQMSMLSAHVSTYTTVGDPQTVSFTVLGAPSGVMVGVQPFSITTGQSATLTLMPTGGTVATGTYLITVIAYGSTASQSAIYTLTVTP